ncbi:MAG: ATP phosphoribosyltransferase regulatory subunit [Hormoscilla sp. SP5CHS1]|nr:ATP phosphoribosyltransferase regulatory subunit [Hormoscilla sp. SP12CHS1]MBC6452985.1 ATP phosphoribosyltransferase regulatory subunit [Hormoscilla sp. SP5CHS1]
MVYQPPPGARDLLPLDVAQKRWLEHSLEQVFHRWGYHQIITSTLERLDTLMAGGAIDRETVIQVENTEEESGLGLRPELTASIARAAATRMSGYPQRLYYNGNVFRRSGQGIHGGQQEFYQAGVELLGAGGLAADAEIMLLLCDCLHQLPLGKWHLILGEARLTRSLLSVFPMPLREKVRWAIAHLDRTTLSSSDLSAELRDRALLLFDLRGRPADVLQRVGNLDLDLAQHETLNNLKSLVELLADSRQRSQAGAWERDQDLSVILDLSLIQTFNYYTGIVFEVVGEQGGRVLGQGGRYDQLLGLYHPQGETYPGIGFSLNIEDLHHVLQSGGQLPKEISASDWLVVPVTAQAYGAAFAYAQQLRETNNVCVEVELETPKTPELVRQVAQNRRIGLIAWVQGDGTTEIEQLIECQN